ncbi:MAG TPA: hypothetical protein PKA19_10025 [Bacillota bacterium]|nr:hypothetical protein [Bacillota bacterium]
MSVSNIRLKQAQLVHRFFYGNKAAGTRLSSANTAFDKSDSLIKSSAFLSGTSPSMRSGRYISQNILTDLNSGEYMSLQQGNVIECNGNRFTVDRIPKIDGTNLKEVKAGDNVIDFGSNNYFKYISADGKEHLLYASPEGFVGSITSEDLRVGGAPYDETLQRYAYFWNYMMSKDPVYVRLQFSDQEVASYLDQAGIKTGFFTVKMGDREATQFYSGSEISGGVHSKQRYDEYYDALTSNSSLLSGCNPGDVFKINDKEYTLSENHTLNIPYGEDIFSIEYPDWYRNRFRKEQSSEISG